MLAASDGAQLREAIKTTLIQLCKVGITYQREIAIEGTIGVTIDKKNIIFVHFADKVSSGRLPGPAETTQSIPAQSEASPPEVTQSHVDAGHDQPDIRLLGSEALSSLHEILNRPHTTTTQQNYETEKPSITEFKSKSLYDPTSSGKIFAFGEGTSISIDSDSDSFGSILDETSTEGHDLLQVKSKSELTFDDDDKRCDSKNIIVIDDNRDLFGMPSADRTANFSLTGLDDATFGGDSGMPEDETEESMELPMKDSIRTMQERDGGHRGKYKAMYENKFQNDSPTPSHHVRGKYGKGSGKNMSKIRKAAYMQHSMKFDCEICGQSLTNNGALESHMITQHDLTETKSLGKISFIKCPHCDKKFRFQAFLDKHLRRHEGIDAMPFRCEVCKNAYQYKESLEIHMLVHASIYECPVCQKDYHTKLLFQKHIVYRHEVQKKKKPKPESTKTVTMVTSPGSDAEPKSTEASDSPSMES